MISILQANREAVVNPTQVRVGRNNLGRCVFAARKFRKSEFIGHVNGEVIADPNYGSNYCMDLGGILSLEPKAPFRYLNHSCQPNCELIAEDADVLAGIPWPRMWVVATRTIHTGEELTIDYAWPEECAIPCLCGAEACRGWVIDEELLSDFLVTLEEEKKLEVGK